jgi:hypothetical protein
MGSLAALRKSSSNLERLQQKAADMNPKGEYDDPRFWYPDVDKSMNGYAVVRLLPAPYVDGDDAVPFVKTFRHSFEGPGGWYIENSLTTIGKEDPVGQLNSRLWKAGDYDDKSAEREQARAQKRKPEYIVGVKVIEEENHPENTGRIALFRMGPQLWDKVDSAMHPKFKDETPINPFEPWDGPVLRIKIKRKDKFRNYEDSVFAANAHPLGTDDEIEALWKSLPSLLEFINPEGKDPKGRPYFKPYEDLEKQLNKVLDETQAAVRSKKAEDTKIVDKPASLGDRLNSRKTQTKVTKDDEEEATPPFDVDSSDPSDAELEKYLKLAKD